MKCTLFLCQSPSHRFVLSISLGLCLFLNLLSSCSQPSAESAIKEVSESNYYQELHRPQFHFSPEANWMNDPNGMVYYDGEYHLFYQYYPDSTVWGPMHWGHAVSPDMVQWEHLPIALYPDSLGYIFSGSAVVDHHNTSGFGENGNPPLIAIFTHHDMAGERAATNKFQYQSIAYSNDKGRTWTKYQGNPVVPNPGIKDFRDPKVIWHEATQNWIMVFAAYDKVRFYTSPDLKAWTYQSDFGIEGDTRLWECPDLFPMNVRGTEETKWVLLTSIQKEAPNGGTASSYFVGDFDGKKFVGDNTNQKWLDYGTDNYAMVTWADVPESDGRRLALGWMSNWQYAQVVPTEKWRSAMTLPRELELYKHADDYVIKSTPVKELATLDGESKIIAAATVQGSQVLLENGEGLYKLVLKVKKPTSGGIEIRFSNNADEMLSVGYGVADNQFYVDRTFAGEDDFSEVFADFHPAPAMTDLGEIIEMTIYLDHASVELFADKGNTVMTDIFFASKPYGNIEIIAETNDVEIIAGELVKLKGIW